MFTTSNTATALTPIVAFFFCDLNANLGNGFRAWTVTGSAPNRQLIIRLVNQKYLGSAEADVGLTADVILTETTNTIDVRYYRIQSSPSRNVEIGIQNAGSSNQWVYIWNDQPFTGATQQVLLENKQVRYTPLNSVPAGSPVPVIPVVVTPVYNNRKYNVEITTAPAQPTYSGMINIPAGDDAVNYAPLGFQFVFYNRTFDSVNISTNGNIQVMYLDQTNSCIQLFIKH